MRQYLASCCVGVIAAGLVCAPATARAQYPPSTPARTDTAAKARPAKRPARSTVRIPVSKERRDSAAGEVALPKVDTVPTPVAAPVDTSRVETTVDTTTRVVTTEPTVPE